MIGKRINGRYKILEMVGGGGMANVYLAHDMILDRNVALKMLRLDFAEDDEFIKRFHREAQSATSLTHQNIVTIYDVGEEDTLYYIVMEYVDGQTLKQYIQKNGPVPLETAIDIMKQLTSAISHAHQNQIIHRDIKPHNILIDHEGKIKITDLFVGKFVIIETEAATSYRLSDEEVFFEIKENGEIVKANMTNEKITSTVGIHKVDEDGNPIKGVTIGVYDLDGNLIYSGVTNEFGDIEFIVEYGSYYFQEIATLDEFELSEEKVYFDVTEDGEYIQRTLINELKEIEVPNTSSNTYIDIIAGAIVLLGTGLIIISSRRKNKK